MFVVAERDADRCLELLEEHRYGVRAARIGRIVDDQAALVKLMTTTGGRRVVQRPYGEELPRIC